MSPADRLPSLKAVRCFDSAARHGSFTLAAVELCVTQGAVSRLIRSLEEDLGVLLFHRTGRQIRLTAAGNAYALQIRGALEQIATASRAVRQGGFSGVLRVSVPPTFALRWLVPRLHRFRTGHPQVMVDITSSEAPIDFRTDAVDVAVRYGLGPWPTAQAHRLMDEAVGLFCAPTLAAGLSLRGEVRADTATVLEQTLLYHSTRTDGWPEFCSACDVPTPDLTHAPAFEHFFMIIEAAAAGMGIALLPLFLARAEVDAGRLCQPVPTTLQRRQGYYLLHSPDAGVSSPVRLFCDWLRQEVAEQVQPAPSWFHHKQDRLSFQDIDALPDVTFPLR